MMKVKDLLHQPCCGYFLQGSVRGVALIDIGLSIFSIFLIASEVFQRFNSLLEMKKNGILFLYYVRILIWSSCFFYKMIMIGLSLFLFKYARKRNARMCKLWIILTLFVNFLLFTSVIASIIVFELSKTVIAFYTGYTLYKAYCLFVVVTFISEINSYGGFNACLSGLTDAEVEEFETGHPPDKALMKDQVDVVKTQAFDKNFEISMDELDIDEDTPLGFGAFGTVYRAKYSGEDSPKTVAVKTVNPNADATYFKTLLGELKIMTFLSPHKNVVNLVGACTSRIKDKKLFIVVEFCPFGNIQDYLKARRGLFFNLVNKEGELQDYPKGMYINVNLSNSVSTSDLIRWSYETACGMEFLEQNKVIHGDLALRNVLLSHEKRAKITDFGLSKKLYQCKNSVQKQDGLLPWKWMAVESLRDLTFSSKSDVWMYGITVWEIFSLGEIPYPGYTWNDDFINQITDGLRISQPANSPNDIYSLMLRCWHTEADSRPSFTEVRKTFEADYNRAVSIVEQVDEKYSKFKTKETDSDADNEVEAYIQMGNEKFTTIRDPMYLDLEKSLKTLETEI